MSQSLYILYALIKLVHMGGEVSFPGGMYEKEDVDLENTALRETEEETGLDKTKVNVIGPIDTVVSDLISA